MRRIFNLLVCTHFYILLYASVKEAGPDKNNNREKLSVVVVVVMEMM